MFAKDAGPLWAAAPADALMDAQRRIPSTIIAAEMQAIGLDPVTIRTYNPIPWLGSLRDPPRFTLVKRAARPRPRSRSPRRRRVTRQRPQEAESDGDGYDPSDDLRKSIEEAYRLVRERIAVGGPGWTPRPCCCRCCSGRLP
jgi:hypothetical protein